MTSAEIEFMAGVAELRQKVRRYEALLSRLIDPEDLGHNVRGQEVWKLIRQELGQTKSAEERGLVRDALKR